MRIRDLAAQRAALKFPLLFAASFTATSLAATSQPPQPTSLQQLARDDDPELRAEANALLDVLDAESAGETP
jgi:hypothetical protein